MTKPARPQFLDQRTYRRKRLIDAAKVLPVLGGIIIIFPLPFLFIDHVLARDAAPLAVYFFGVWVVLIIGSAIFARRIGNPAGED